MLLLLLLQMPVFFCHTAAQLFSAACAIYNVRTWSTQSQQPLNRHQFCCQQQQQQQ
jgi:hypothetical protein